MPGARTNKPGGLEQLGVKPAAVSCPHKFHHSVINATTVFAVEAHKKDANGRQDRPMLFVRGSVLARA
jgi:hypothetical protein